jgi:predicted metal-dependent hydrolase
MREEVRQLPDGSGGTLTVRVRRDKRLRKSLRASFEQGEVLVRVPPNAPDDQLDEIIAELVEKLVKQRTRSKQREDAYLAERADYLNRKHFDGELSWNSIRWVGNMRRRLGSCTNGGPTDGDIRISDRIKGWPEWVIDYVIAHEIVHRAHPNHSKAFWEMVNRYPKTERARGFVEGVGFAENAPLEMD